VVNLQKSTKSCVLFNVHNCNSETNACEILEFVGFRGKSPLTAIFRNKKGMYDVTTLIPHVFLFISLQLIP
jgi:hypothetical protein